MAIPVHSPPTRNRVKAPANKISVLAAKRKSGHFRRNPASGGNTMLHGAIDLGCGPDYAPRLARQHAGVWLLPCRLTVRQRTLTPFIEVRILAGHPARQKGQHLFAGGIRKSAWCDLPPAQPAVAVAVKAPLRKPKPAIIRTACRQCGAIAQMGERSNRTAEVGSSILPCSTNGFWHSLNKPIARAAAGYRCARAWRARRSVVGAAMFARRRRPISSVSSPTS